jgi:hypothetical protein
MSEAVKDMIQQALDQDYNDANNTFNDVMTIKMSDLLDQEKVRLADQIYNGVEPNDEDDDDIVGDEDGDDQLELDLETEGESESEGETEEEDEEEDFEYDEDDVEEVDSEKSE